MVHHEFDVKRMTVNLNSALESSKTDRGRSYLVRFNPEAPAGAKAYGYIPEERLSNYGQIRDLYDSAEIFLRVEGGDITVLRDDNRNYSRMVCAEVKAAMPVAPPVELLPWQQREAEAQAKEEARIALRGSIRSFLGM